MKKKFLTWSDVEGAVLDIIQQMSLDNWKPDYVVGLTRGGLTPAVLVSQFLNIPCHTLRVCLRDHDDGGPETNCWMSEDAYGYDDQLPKNILIIDDINDTGATLDWIKSDWQGSCLPKDPKWETIWGNNVRFAVLTHNLSSNSEVEYSCWEINKDEEDVWIVHPWEDFWK